MERKLYGASSLETAACLWEAVLALEPIGPMGTNGTLEQEQIGAAIRAARERIGTSALRQTVIGWTDALKATWALVDTIAGSPGSYSGSFDWDFVPAWIAERVDWSGEYPTLRAEARS